MNKLLAVGAALWVAFFRGLAAGEESAPRPTTPGSEMVYIPAGDFIMGTSEEEAQALAKENEISPKFFACEAPKRKVNLKAFWIDRFPVTTRQALEFLKAATNCPRREWIEEHLRLVPADHPVVDVDYDFALAYANWAGKRLPTAEEWEKAARGTDGRLYPWGNDWKDSAAHRRPPDAFMPPGSRLGEGCSYTVPVGCYPEGASPYGVMDMCGNVAEYTATFLDNGSDFHVIKGARATTSLKCFFRCASMAYSDCDGARGGRGFRCVKDAPEPPPPSYKLSALPHRVPPALPQPLPPREDLYLKAPITLEPGPKFRIPYLPDGCITLMAPESLRILTSSGQSVRLKETPYIGGEWRVSSNGTRLDREYKFTEKQVSMHIVFESHLDYVDFWLTLKNDSAETNKSVRAMTCQCCGLPYFYNHELTTTYIFTDAGPRRLIDYVTKPPLFPGWQVLPAGQAGPPGVPVARFPFVCTASADGKWVRVVARAAAGGGASNGNYCCLHLENPPQSGWLDLKPGEEDTSMIRYYFLRGGLDTAMARWKTDFVK